MLRGVAAAFLAVGLSFGGLEAQDASTADWRSWRGSDGRATATDGAPPLVWSESKNVAFKVAIPGSGSSSPIILGDRLFLTSAIETDTAGKPAVLPDPDAKRFAGPTPSRVHDYVLLAYDRKTGRRLWQKTLVSEVPHEGLHRTTTQANASPVTDGEVILVPFGSRGLYCVDTDGKPKWSKRLGVMRTRREWGEAASVAIHGDTVIVNWDHEGESFIVALNKSDGKERWRKSRDEVTSWSTPLVVTVGDRPQVVVAATTASRGYDLATGDVVWSCKGMTVNCIPTPIYAHGLIYLMSGYRGRMLQAVEIAGAKGDITESKKVVWRHRKATSYVPSGIAVGEEFYFLRGNSGRLSCLDAKSGEVRYEGEQLRGIRSVYASPVATPGRIYWTSRDGCTVVIKPGKAFEVLATNRLDDTFDASAAIVGDWLYMRGRRHLYALRESAGK